MGAEEKEVLAREAKDVAAPVDDNVWGGFNEWQLWSIFLSLDQSQLVEPLKRAQQNLAHQAKAYGDAHYDWIK